MLRFARLCGVMVLSMSAAWVHAGDACPEALNFKVTQLGTDNVVNLCEQYRDQVVVIVNTASKCGLTPQYEGLEALYSRYRERGLAVLGFPSNDFGSQEPGTENQIKDFCKMTYGVQFPMFQKTQVRADNADPLYQTLGRLAQQFPEWNFHKYLIDRSGKLVANFPSKMDPKDPAFVAAVEKLL